MATPPSLSTVLTSLKSRLMSPWLVMISAIDLAATLRVSSALPKASSTVSSGYISRRRSLLITSNASTCLAISSTPSRAWSILRFPSKRNGMVTIPTVSMPSSLLTRAMTGAAPVPVPPPIPAVMNVILVPSLSICLIESRLSSAAWRAFAGLLPAPSPSVPSCKSTGTGESLRAWLSVLQSTNDTSCMPSRYIWLTALPPPPPTPITLMIVFFDSFSGVQKSTIGLILLSGICVISFFSFNHLNLVPAQQVNVRTA